jgi:hypothetical protein
VVHRFATVAELLDALHAFKAAYNATWLVTNHQHRTPVEVRLALTAEQAA